MLDLKKIRQNPQPFMEGLRKRNASFEPIHQIISLDADWRAAKQESDGLKSQRNVLSSQINEAKKEGKDIKKIIEETRKISEAIKSLDAKASSLEEQMQSVLLNVPNVPHESVPKGNDENGNVEISKWGKAEKNEGNTIPHYELGPALKMMDFERGAKISGSRFTVLYGKLAKLERALAHYMLQTASSNGYLEVLPPYIVNSKSMQGTGQLPKFAEELYKLEGTDYWLIPTSEVPLGNLHADEILQESSLPLKYCALTPNFRKEAGNYQKDIKGYLRQHQFNKVELFKYAHPQNSYDEHEKMLKDSQSILEGLGIPYRTMLLCSGDMGFAAAKTYDLEAWLPSQGKYREIASISNCADFQARRSNIKFRQGGKNEYVHTLNGSALAIGRTLIAIMENFQEGNQIIVPKVLQDFMQEETIGL